MHRPKSWSSSPPNVLEGSKGLLVVDAHGAYKKLVQFHPDLKLALCWTHARRESIEAEAAYSQATAAIDLMRELFAIEGKLPNFRFIEDEAERAKALKEIPRDTKWRDAPACPEFANMDA
ncbi:MAG: transposase [Myxococcales bacterium]|nr:transposase [Myxococcales bacterium]